MPYIERQLKAASDPILMRRGQVAHACVQHDDYCPVLTLSGGCICDPDILVLCENGDRYEIDRQGSVVSARATLVCHHGYEKLRS